MAPSRGLTLLFSTSRTQSLRPSSYRFSSTFSQSLARSTQIYISRSLSPTLNLSIEHHLLKSTPQDSTILFLYTDRPSIIIGRNQNPWTEVNLSALNHNESGNIFELVRRRSGGGTVMHDEGNVNYSVICPSKDFDRDKHALMVVKALKSLGVDGARVNCRHDIVVDVGSSSGSKDVAPASKPKVAEGCELKTGPEDGKKTFKVSGSAYKLTRLRSLHHGTCLLSSPNLKTASKLLTSPGKPFFKARGVESVRSPITNVEVKNEDFEGAVVKEFKAMYGSDAEITYVGEEEGRIHEIAKGMAELESKEWIYEQTPQFTFDTEVETVSEVAQDLPEAFKASFTIRHGTVTESSIIHPTSFAITSQQGEAIASHLRSTPLHQIKDWNKVFGAYTSSQSNVGNPGNTFNTIFGCSPSQ